LFCDEYRSKDFDHDNELKKRKKKNQFWDETFWISFSKRKKSEYFFNQKTFLGFYWFDYASSNIYF
jgi:hypothetical protein